MVRPILCVDDLAKAITFYGALFDLDLDRPLADSAFLRGASFDIRLERPGAPRVDVDPDFSDVDFTSPSRLVLQVGLTGPLARRVAGAVEAGAHLERPICEIAMSDLEDCILVDPFGHRWLIVGDQA